jgi:hypothetical protein
MRGEGFVLVAGNQLKIEQFRVQQGVYALLGSPKTELYWKG